ncbi:unnamed protein product [Ectocarpus sp. 13 AM-2016]
MLCNRLPHKSRSDFDGLMFAVKSICDSPCFRPEGTHIKRTRDVIPVVRASSVKVFRCLHRYIPLAGNIYSRVRQKQNEVFLFGSSCRYAGRNAEKAVRVESESA